MEKPLKLKELEAMRYIRNYIVHKGQSPSIRELMTAMKYRSPRSISLIIEQLVEKGFLRRKFNGDLQIIQMLTDDPMRAETVDIPLVGTVTCGIPILATENLEAMIPVSTQLARPPHKYFLLRAKGDSMNLKGINDGDLVLVRQQTTAQPGDSVVALIDDEATIKEFRQTKEAIVLQPQSSNIVHKPIILTRDFQIQGIVVTTIQDWR